MYGSARFCVNQPAVIGEVIDDEAIIVNLDSGAYYSLRDSGAAIWCLIEQGADMSQITARMSQQYSATAEVVEAAVGDLLAELKKEQLIVLADESVPPPAMPISNNVDPAPFVKPVLEKFTDMADLLLLDPIHEVDEKGGWPHPA